MPPSSPETQQTTKVTVFAIPLKAKEPNIKLVSINQCENSSTNGYKQFDINISSQNAQNIKKAQCIKDITINNIHLNIITVLSLRNCSLQILPREIHILPLKELDLMHNCLSHIPECLYLGLQQIEVLNLAHNPLTCFNIVPKCVGNLKILNLEDCKFINMPTWIQEMKTISLEEFCFSRNNQTRLKRSDRPQLAAKVRKLVLNNTGLRQSMLGFFKSFNLLQYLDISNSDTDQKMVNALNDVNELLCNVSWFRHIRILKLNNLHISELSDELCGMINLKELHLKQNLLLTIPMNICNLKDLVVLDISYNCIYSLPDLTGLHMLHELHAAKNHLSTIALVNMQRLMYVDLYDNDLETLELSAPCMIECIDVEQNCIDVNMLLNGSIGNGDYEDYEGRRESLRSLRSRTGNEVMFEWRAIGRKLGVFELDSPTDDLRHLGDSDDDEYGDGDADCYSDGRYSDNGDEGLGGRDSQGGTYKIEDAEWNSGDDGSDWGETGTDGLVTLSDAEFFPEDAAEVKVTYSQDNVVNVEPVEAIQFDDLFIDAD